MSIVVGYYNASEAHVIVDSLLQVRDVGAHGSTSKAFYLPHLRAVIAFRGSLWFPGRLMTELGCGWNNVDDLLSVRFQKIYKDLDEELTSIRTIHPQNSETASEEIVVFGWSEKKNRVISFGMNNASFSFFHTPEKVLLSAPAVGIPPGVTPTRLPGALVAIAKLQESAHIKDVRAGRCLPAIGGDLVHYHLTKSGLHVSVAGRLDGHREFSEVEDTSRFGRQTVPEPQTARPPRALKPFALVATRTVGTSPVRFVAPPTDDAGRVWICLESLLKAAGTPRHIRRSAVRLLPKSPEMRADVRKCGEAVYVSPTVAEAAVRDGISKGEITEGILPALLTELEMAQAEYLQAG